MGTAARPSQRSFRFQAMGGMRGAPREPGLALLHASQGKGAGGDDQAVDDVAGGPGKALGAEVERGLDEQREGEERREASGIAGRVQRVGILLRLERPPALDQRRRAGEHHEGGSDGAREGQQEPGRGPFLPERRTWGQGRGQRRRRAGHHRQVHEHLPRGPQVGRQEVRVQVAQEQGGLEEHHAGVPHRGCATEDGEEELGRHGLHDEQEARAQEDGGHGKASPHPPAPLRAVWTATIPRVRRCHPTAANPASRSRPASDGASGQAAMVRAR